MKVPGPGAPPNLLRLAAVVLGLAAMSETKAYAAHGAKQKLVPFSYPRRAEGPEDVRIKVHFCGICHSDVHQVGDEWGGSSYPMVPGHEVAGTVEAVGANVKRFRVGDRVGVGVFVDSCRKCGECHAGLEQFCAEGMTATYNDVHRDGRTPTYGGYSNEMVVNARYVLRLDPSLPLDRAAPLLCAGITTYSPLKHWGAGPGKKVGIVGLGGLGHMGVKLAVAMGAEVTVLSHSRGKEADAKRMGAKHFVATSEPAALKGLKNTFDLLLNTVSELTEIDALLGLLRLDGAMVMVGLPAKPVEVRVSSLTSWRRSLAGSHIGGIAETQEMLDFCAKHAILCDVERVLPSEINAAYARIRKSDVRYRFVVDAQALLNPA